MSVHESSQKVRIQLVLRGVLRGVIIHNTQAVPLSCHFFDVRVVAGHRFLEDKERKIIMSLNKQEHKKFVKLHLVKQVASD